MQFSINTNPSATQASLNLSRASDMHRKSLARLSSGQRIVNPADDAGGLAVGNKLDSKLARLEKVGQNLKNTSSFLELQESALAVVGTIITRMSELKTMATDVTKNSSDVENYNKEFVELQKQIEAMTKHKFNGISLFSDTNMFAGTDADGRAGHGLDLARNFVLGEYVAESGAVLGQGTSSNQDLSNYTFEQWRMDYDQWINLNGSVDPEWNTKLAQWKLNPEPYGGLKFLDDLNLTRQQGHGYVHFRGGSAEVSDLTPLGSIYSHDTTIVGNPQLSDISPLANMSIIVALDLSSNNISDLRPLFGKDLNVLDLRDNPITQSQKEMLESSMPHTTIAWPNEILPDPSGNIDYPSLDQFTTEDFTNFTQSAASAMAEVGSHQSRLNMEMQHNETARVNLEAAKSRIMDADMAQESSRFAKTNVLVQSSASMVAQANQLSDIALRLMVNR
jgi:flagellin-like hook-associated protein FlgL